MDQLFRYLTYRKRSVSRHAIHSPFIFDFIQKVLKGKAAIPQAGDIELVRRRLLTSSSEVIHEDFGASGEAKKESTKRISEIAKKSLSTKRQCQILYKMVRHFDSRNIVELGTSLGISTAYLAAASDGVVTTFEGSSAVAEVARANWRELSLDNIEMKIGDFDQTLAKRISEFKSLDLIFIDGNHRKEPTLQYFDLALSKAHNDTVILFDDIHWSAEMESAWESIKSHEKTVVSLDIFWMGVVFLRRELTRAHFTIRY